VLLLRQSRYDLSLVRILPGYQLIWKITRLCVVLFLVGRNFVQLRDFHSAAPLFRCRHSVSRHSGLAESMVVRVEPLGLKFNTVEFADVVGRYAVIYPLVSSSVGLALKT